MSAAAAAAIVEKLRTMKETYHTETWTRLNCDQVIDEASLCLAQCCEQIILIIGKVFNQEDEADNRGWRAPPHGP